MKIKTTILITMLITLIILASCANNAQTKEQGEEEMNPIVTMQTNMGTIKIELYPKKAPKTVENFLSYANEGFYEGTIFHRVINNFMVQGGGFLPNGQQKDTKSPIILESDNGLKNEEGTIAMARTMEPNSATSQFFINVANNEFLNHGARDDGYAVFGKVIEGMETVNKIKGVQTTSNGPYQDWPAEPVIIEKVTVEE